LALAKIPFSNTEAIVANVTNAKTFSWNDDLFPALREAGLDIKDIEPIEWVESLRNSSNDVVANPTFKLVDIFRLNVRPGYIRSNENLLNDARPSVLRYFRQLVSP
jgi:hypothetical protein